MTGPRVRLAGATVTLEVVTDDGTELAPVAVRPLRLSPAELASFDVSAVLAQIAQEVGATTEA